MESCSEYLELPEPTPESDPSWFGFPLSLKSNANLKRLDLLTFLDKNQVGTRLLFSGNLLRQPYMQNRPVRISGNLSNTDRIMSDTFWIGVYPGLTNEMLEYTVGQLEKFFGIS